MRVFYVWSGIESKACRTFSGKKLLLVLLDLKKESFALVLLLLALRCLVSSMEVYYFCNFNTQSNILTKLP